MKNKCFLLIAMIAVVAFSGCKQDENDVQKKVVLTNIPAKYKDMEIKLSLFKVQFSLKPEVIAITEVKGGSATFALVNEDDEEPFTGTGTFLPAFTIADANGFEIGLAAGTSLVPLFINRETTTVAYTSFTVQELPVP